jgi:hypothetical protein
VKINGGPWITRAKYWKFLRRNGEIALPRWPNGVSWRLQIRIIWIFGDWFALA